MKTNILPLLLTALSIFAACSPRQSAPAGADSLRTGDLVFVAIPADYDVSGRGMAGAIAASTGSDSLRIIHVAIVEVDSLGAPWIIDATIAHGVDRHPLDTMLTDFTLREGRATYLVRRVNPAAVPEGWDPVAAVERAKSFCGLPYDVHFLPDNGALYCSELVRNSYLDPDAAPVFAEAPMNFRDGSGEFPEYWVWLFGQLGVPIPQDIPGTNPDAMSREAILLPVDVAL